MGGDADSRSGGDFAIIININTAAVLFFSTADCPSFFFRLRLLPPLTTRLIVKCVADVSTRVLEYVPVYQCQCTRVLAS